MGLHKFGVIDRNEPLTPAEVDALKQIEKICETNGVDFDKLLEKLKK
jgi:enamine deaminase RidA (YjgF/YER057c/UK114 family)